MTDPGTSPTNLADLPLFAAVEDPPSLTTTPSASTPPPGPDTAGRPATLDTNPPALDWSAVNLLRVKASDRLTTSVSERLTPLTGQAQRELGRTIILDLLDGEARSALTAGRTPTDPVQQRRLAQAVYDALFGLGRLQPLVDDERVENIEVNGYDNVTLQFSDGHGRRGRPWPTRMPSCSTSWPSSPPAARATPARSAPPGRVCT